MPTVPGGEEENGGSIAAQAYSPKIKKVGQGDASFPIGQVESGTYGDLKWQQFRSLREESARQTADEQTRAISDIGEAFGSKLGPGWDKMIKEGPKSKNIEYRSGDYDPTRTEVEFMQYDAKKAREEWLKKPLGQNVLGLPSPSDEAYEAAYKKRKPR